MAGQIRFSPHLLLLKHYRVDIKFALSGKNCRRGQSSIKMRVVRKSVRGFTVVETVVTLTIIAVLAAIAIPITQSQLRLHRLDVTASIIGNKLMEARMDAIKRNLRSRLLVTTAGTAQVQWLDSGGNATNIGTAEAFPPDIVLVSGSDITIVFDSMGRTTAVQTFTISDTQTDSRKDVSVSLAGKVTVGAMY